MDFFTASSVICSIIVVPILVGYIIYILLNLIRDGRQGVQSIRQQRRAAGDTSSLLSIENIDDLTLLWEANWKREANRLQASGYIPAAEGSTADGLYVEFNLNVTGIGRPQGSIEALTKEHAFNYQLQGGSVEVQMDGTLLGKIDQFGNVFSDMGLPLAEAPKSDGAPMIYRAGITRRANREEYYGVFMEEGPVAYISDISTSEILRIKRIGSREIPMAVTLNEGISEQARIWATALTLLHVLGFLGLRIFWETDPLPVEA